MKEHNDKMKQLSKNSSSCCCRENQHKKRNIRNKLALKFSFQVKIFHIKCNKIRSKSSPMLKALILELICSLSLQSILTRPVQNWQQSPLTYFVFVLCAFCTMEYNSPVEEKEGERGHIKALIIVRQLQCHISGILQMYLLILHSS